MGIMSVNESGDLTQRAQRLPVIMDPVTPLQIEHWLTLAANVPSFLAAARAKVIDGHFDPSTEKTYLIAWRCICNGYDRWNGVTLDILMALADIEQTNHMLSASEHYDLFRKDTLGLLYTLIHNETDNSKTNRDSGYDFLEAFVHQRGWQSDLKRIYGQITPTGIPVNLLEDTREAVAIADRIKASMAPAAVDIVPDRGSFNTPALVIHPTGINIIDHAVGGNIEGDVNGLLGPIGGGKTTLLVQLLVETAKRSYEEASRENRTPPLTFMVTLEEPADRLLSRILACAARIPRKKLDIIGGQWDLLTGPNNMEDYERALWDDESEVLCEQERWDHAQFWLKKVFKVIDLSGVGKAADGSGGIMDIMYQMRRTMDDTGQSTRCVGIDYAGLQCERQMFLAGKDERYLRLLLKHYSNECRRQIALPESCTVWVNHQLNAESATKNPTALLHHTQSGECRTIAENMMACLCLGAEDVNTGCRRLNPSKVRAFERQKLAAPTLKIHSDFAYMYDAGGQYGIDEASHKFIDRNDAARLAGVEQATRRNGNPRLTEEAAGVDNPRF